MWPRILTMSTRLDKWLTIARVYKTRTLSAHACDLSRVRVNGVAVKPHRNLVVGDRIEAEVTSDWTRVLIVQESAARRWRARRGPAGRPRRSAG